MQIDRRSLLKIGALAGGWFGSSAACSEAGPTDGPQVVTRTTARGGPFIQTRDGIGLFHLDWGDGPPVMFQHAWALNADIWEYQMGALVERGLRCVAYDRRGHGRSADPGGGYDFDTLADDLAAVLDQLDLRGVTLVGHSMGCGEMVRYLSRHGSARVARLVMVSGVGPTSANTPGNAGGFAAFAEALKTDRPAALTAGVSLFVGRQRQVSPEMSQWVVAQFLRCSPQAALGCMRSVANADFTADLAAVRLPTLIVHGDDDALSSLEGNGRATAQLIPGSRLEIYPGGPHGLILTDRDRFNRDLLAFVQS
jgi:non-heme chloroperoxidase